MVGCAAMPTLAQPPVTAIILAAGQGTRMKSARPKVLHELCGRPMISSRTAVFGALKAESTRLGPTMGRGCAEAHIFNQ